LPIITVSRPVEEEKLTKEDIKRLAEELRDVMSEEIIEEISDRRHKKLSYRSGKDCGQTEGGFNDDMRKEVYERNHATVALEQRRDAQNASHLSYYEVNMQVMLEKSRLSTPLNEGDSLNNEMVSVQHHFNNLNSSLLAGPNTSLAVVSPTPNFDRPHSDL